jgi:hypothetical protein
MQLSRSAIATKQIHLFMTILIVSEEKRGRYLPIDLRFLGLQTTNPPLAPVHRPNPVHWLVQVH